MQNLKTYLKRVMKEKGLMAIDIEKRSGRKITDSYISNILKGKAKNLTVDKIVALAQGLDVESIEVFKVASGVEVESARQKEWDAHILLRTMDKIVLNSELTEAVKTLVDMKPAKLKKALALLKEVK